MSQPLSIRMNVKDKEDFAELEKRVGAFEREYTIYGDGYVEASNLYHGVVQLRPYVGVSGGSHIERIVPLSSPAKGLLQTVKEGLISIIIEDCTYNIKTKK